MKMIVQSTPVSGDSAPQITHVCLVADAADQAIEFRLRAIADVIDCERTVLVRRDGCFREFVPVCDVHRWVGQATGTEEGADLQICQIRVQRLITAGRAEHLLAAGFQPVERE